MKTDPAKHYKIRNMTKAHGSIDGWFGRRKNGDFYLKRFPGGASTFNGGPKLDSALRKHPDLKAYDT